MFKVLCLCVLLGREVITVRGQELNVIPNLLRPYFRSVDEHMPINLMANISEKVFNIKKMGFSFDPTMLRHDYDFIIVGGGTAGSVLANRLSENLNWNILVLEAGRPESAVNFVPLLAAYLIKSTYDWSYTAEKTPGSCIFTQNERCAYHAGKALGGSSATNYMLYIRGNKQDYEEWKALGNEGWGYEDVLPYFKEIETAKIDGADTEFRGTHGEMSVMYPPFRSALTDFFVAAAKESGYDVVDYNGPNQLGVSYMQTNLLNGRRHSAASAFIHPIYKKRKNLHVVTSAMVSKVLIDESTKTAVGVAFERDRQTYTVYAKKEVILSAGALRSPQLLMLSGIGPKEQLDALNINVIKDLPVGKRFYDHTAFIALIFTTNTTNLSLHLKRLGVLDAIEFVEGKGQLTSAVNVEAVLYGKREDSPLDSEQPDYELLFFPGSFASDVSSSLAPAFHIKQSFYDEFFKPLESTRLDHFSIIVHQMRPQSFGNIRLRDKNVYSHPLFYHNFFSNPDDVEAQLAGVKAGIRIAESSIMKGLGASIYKKPVPGCEHNEFGSDEYWRCAIRVASIGTHHYTGSCRMGPESSEETVVDDQLRVHGIKRLRVIDNSIMPSMVCAHTHVPALMIGAKGAAIIKQFWRALDQ